VTASLDTDLLLRLTLRDVPEQYDCVKSLIKAPGARYFVSDLAIAEMVHALQHHYGFTRSQVAEVVRAVLTDPGIEANRALLDPVLSSFVNQPALSYSDCYLAEEARLSGRVPLLTFDRDLARHHPSAQLARTREETT